MRQVKPLGCGKADTAWYLWWIIKGKPQANSNYRHGGCPYGNPLTVTHCGRSYGDTYVWICADCAAKAGFVW